eukprot:8470940-Prorocentrum_lima.AAC.1
MSPLAWARFRGGLCLLHFSRHQVEAAQLYHVDVILQWSFVWQRPRITALRSFQPKAPQRQAEVEGHQVIDVAKPALIGEKH